MARNSKENSSKKAALDYHEFPQPGKLEIRATKPLANQRDLSRAYSPGVAEACLEIKEDENTASKYTSKGNLVAVISNGTAVLGLGNIGALASKPVMEGKAVLFKKFADIDGIDLEVNTGEVVGLIGPNGSGKTTTINLVTGIYSSDAGSVILDGKHITNKAANKITRAGMARTFQNLRIFERLTVKENIMVAQNIFNSSFLNIDLIPA